MPFDVEELCENLRKVKYANAANTARARSSSKSANPKPAVLVSSEAERRLALMFDTEASNNKNQDYVMEFWAFFQTTVNCFIHKMRHFFAPFQRDSVLKFCNSTIVLGLYWLVFVLVLFFLYYFRIQIQQWGPIYVWLSCLFMFTTLFAHYFLCLRWYYVIIANVGLIFVIHSIDYNTDSYLTNLDSQLGNAMFYHKLSHNLVMDESNAELTVLNAVASLLKVTHACFSKGAAVNNLQCHEELQMSHDLVNKYMSNIYSVVVDNSVVKQNYKVSTGPMGNYKPTFISKEDVVSEFKYKPIDQVELRSKQNLILLAMSRLLDGNRYENTVEDIARNTWYSFITASIPFKSVDWVLKVGQVWSSQPNDMFRMLSIGRLGFEFLSKFLDYAFPIQHRYKQVVHKFHPEIAHDASHMWSECNHDFCTKTSNRNLMRLSELALELRLKAQSLHIPSAYDKCPSLSDITDVNNTYIEMVDCVDFKKLCLQSMDRHNQAYDQWICPEVCMSKTEVKTAYECNNTKEYCQDKYPVACNNTKEYCMHSFPVVCNETVVNTSTVQNNFTCPVVNVSVANVTDDDFSRIQWNESTCRVPACSERNGSAWIHCHWAEATSLVNGYFFTLLSTVIPILMMPK
jgi:hypothetical protein